MSEIYSNLVVLDSSNLCGAVRRLTFRCRCVIVFNFFVANKFKDFYIFIISYFYKYIFHTTVDPFFQMVS